MTSTIELIYSSDCPNVEMARDRLRAALSQLGVELAWTEWDLTHAEAPVHARRYGSPTILIGGRDVELQVAGDDRDHKSAPACRLYDNGGRHRHRSTIGGFHRRGVAAEPVRREHNGYEET